MHKSVKMVQFIIILPIILLFTYLSVTTILVFFPKTGDCKGKSLEYIYLFHSSTHTEIILPIKPDSTWIRYFLFDSHPKRGFIAFSYADEAFMLNTPTWDDVDYRLAAKALFYPTPSVIQVGNYADIKYDACIKIPLNVECLEKLAKSISDSFMVKDGRYIKVQSNSKFGSLYYYRAKEPYTLFHTCNSWTANRLQDAGLKAPYLAPFVQQIVYVYR